MLHSIGGHFTNNAQQQQRANEQTEELHNIGATSSYLSSLNGFYLILLKLQLKALGVLKALSTNNHVRIQ